MLALHIAALKEWFPLSWRHNASGRAPPAELKSSGENDIEKC